MQEKIKRTLEKRYRKERRFKLFGLAAIAFACLFLAVFLAVIYAKGNKAFVAHKLGLEVDFSLENIAKRSQLSGKITDLSKEDLLESVSYQSLIHQALREKFPQSRTRKELNSVYSIVSENADFMLQEILMKDSDLLGGRHVVWLALSSKADIYLKYGISPGYSMEESSRVKELERNGHIKSFFNWGFFTFTDSREPESAGIAASLMGSFLVMAVFLLFAFPIGVMCAFYLEEFAPKNKMTDLIEISINNLAAVPSIIYGLLGLTVYLQFMALPRSSALVGGMTLFMLVLPVIIIATRNTIRTIPDSIRDGAMALGASKTQVMLHHVFPLSIPGIMTGTILAMSRALGETAPLLMIGMVAFIADVPGNFTDPTTVLPVQIYLWSDSPEIGFAEKTSAAIMVLLGFLIVFNLVAIVIRKRFERKW